MGFNHRDRDAFHVREANTKRARENDSVAANVTILCPELTGKRLMLYGRFICLRMALLPKHGRLPVAVATRPALATGTSAKSAIAFGASHKGAGSQVINWVIGHPAIAAEQAGGVCSRTSCSAPLDSLAVEVTMLNDGERRSPNPTPSPPNHLTQSA